MKKSLLAVRLGLMFAVSICSGRGWGQAVPTATQTLDLAVFGAGTGTYTGLEGGKNEGITAGVDLSIKSFYHFHPGIEARGNYAVHQGTIDGQKSVLIGPRVTRTFGKFTPYVDGFFGRGELKYPQGIIVNNYRYDRTTTNIYAGGGGLDLRVTRHFDLMGDVQFERWATPVVTTGRIYSKPISAGVVYHFDFNHYGRGPREGRKRRELKAGAGASSGGQPAPLAPASRPVSN